MASVSQNSNSSIDVLSPRSQPQIASPTQRAYTLRLRPAISEGDDAKKKRSELQEALWSTHEAINHGAKAFGDWLLTLRGGLDHSLADMPNKKAQVPSDTERRDRRVMLALSWLTVEDERGAPKEPGLIVAYGHECKARQHGQAERDELVVAALRAILLKRGLTLSKIESWVTECTPSLTARIRGDAVWVNRSESFDSLAQRWTSLNRANAALVLTDFFGDQVEWLTIPNQAETSEHDESSQDGAPSSGRGDDAQEFRTIARSFLSINFGSGEKSDRASTSDALREAAEIIGAINPGLSGSTLWRTLCQGFSLDTAGDDDACKAAVLDRIGWLGRPSTGRVALETNAAKAALSSADLDGLRTKLLDEAQKKQAQSGKVSLPWVKDLQQSVAGALGFGYVVERDLIGEYGVMLDHAARRVSIAHSWIKLAELERRAFEADAAKMGALTSEHPAAVTHLDDFRASRGRDTGSIRGEPLLIRKRAITGWKDVVTGWGRAACKSVDDRVAAMRALQDELEKFGDHTLFERVAADEAKIVWQRPDGTPDHTILTRYVDGTVALANQQRFKVPAYRHPDPLRAPVFGEFGNSRWGIDFAVHKRVSIEAKGKKPSKPDTAYLANDHNMRLGLWTGQRVESVNLRWSSKRLSADLGLRNLTGDTLAIVTRADRLGRAASNVTGAVNVASVFAEMHWNGRLQAPRAELDRIARFLDKGNIESAAKAKARLSWLVTFSPKLAPAGPFIDYAAERGIPANKKGEYYPNSDVNKADKREGQAKLMLARLPGLRVLSVDLGHRFAAACAVWETMSAATFMQAIAGGVVVAGGSGPSDLYCHVRTKGSNGRERTTIFRRVGSDTLDGKPHPAPWARLDRQFLIKLQGEEETPRKMSDAERDMLKAWRILVGAEELPNAARSWNIAEGMSDGAWLLKQAIRRHADRARIAHNLTATTRTRPGGQPETLDHAGRVQLVAETLALWHGLFSGERWTDGFARSLWTQAQLPDLPPPVRSGKEEGEPAFGGAARRKAQEAFINALRPHAERIVSDESLATRLSERWADRWEQDDRVLEHRGHRSGLLRELRRWVAPRGLGNKPQAARAARHVGGLSVGRINTLTATYRLLKAFKNRPVPADLRRNIPAKGDDRLARFHQRLLDMRDRLRDQRVKQLASRIVEAALGIGRIPSEHIAAGAARPTVRVDAPCHAVVIESLTNYRPDELQTRRENRQLMDWSSAKVQKYLKEGCQLHGLHLREVQPNYTSRQCSRTGAPGLRCVQVSAAEVLTGYWKKDADRARGRVEKARKEGRDGAQADLLLIDAGDWAARLPDTMRAVRRIVLPKRGGDLFVAVKVSRGKNGHVAAVQADLNAAANIGLRALLDPDWPGRWWFVPCTGGTFSPAPEKTRNAAVFLAVNQLPHEGDSPEAVGGEPGGPVTGKRKGKKASSGSAAEKAIENRWRDVSAASVSDGRWVTTAAYWNFVQAQVCKGLRRQCAASTSDLEKAPSGR
ncbi:MAG: type V CRISPR-associated protein Cas12b [Phycisphaeraceae bacterium]|nr:type V CRISPR-associated protein Cas12b [Phycisphaeraceae bacterium]